MISSLNEDSRILAMSRSVEQDMLLSASFADTLGSRMQRHLGEGQKGRAADGPGPPARQLVATGSADRARPVVAGAAI